MLARLHRDPRHRRRVHRLRDGVGSDRRQLRQRRALRRDRHGAACATCSCPPTTATSAAAGRRISRAKPATRAWIDAYAPGAAAPLPAGVDTTNLSTPPTSGTASSKHWCREAQRLLAATPTGRRREGPAQPVPATMLRWRELHPYNAVHVRAHRRAARRAAAVRARSAGCSQALGLTGLALDAARGRYEYRRRSRDRRARRAAPRGGDALRAAADARSSASSTPRFRPTARSTRSASSRSTTGETFLLGLAYDHFIAGGDSIVVLMTDAARRATSIRTAPRRGAWTLYPPDLRPAASRAMRCALLTGTAGARRRCSGAAGTPPARTTAPACRRPTRSQLRTVDAATLAAGAQAWRSLGRHAQRPPARAAAAGDGAARRRTAARPAPARWPSRRSSTSASAISSRPRRRLRPVPELVPRHPPDAGRPGRSRRSPATCRRRRGATKRTQALPADAARHRRQRRRLALHVARAAEPPSMPRTTRSGAA